MAAETWATPLPRVVSRRTSWWSRDFVVRIPDAIPLEKAAPLLLLRVKIAMR
jgi:hypothetical protein